MRYPKWILVLIVVFFLGPGSINATDKPSIFSPEGFFNTISQIAGHSVPRISTLIARDYPEFPNDIAGLVEKKYPSLRNEVYVHLNLKYPGLYREAVDFIRRESPATFGAHRKDLKNRKKDIAKGRVGPSDLLWERLEADPALKVRVMAEIDKEHPEIKFKILSRINEHYPALKIDLFNLILRQYPDMVWDVAKIATSEAVNEMGRL